MSRVDDEMIQMEGEPPHWWPFCVEAGCENRVCTWRSGKYCYPHCDAHGIPNPRALEFALMPDADNDEE